MTDQQNNNFITSFNSIVIWVFILFMLVCIAYYYGFSYNLSAYSDSDGFFQRGLNIHDHLVYEQSMEKLVLGDTSLKGNNDYGIALIYLILIKFFTGLVNNHFTLIAFIFNCIFLVFTFFLYVNLCNKFNISSLGKMTFFANTYFIYFTQLINKDMLTVFFFLLMVYCGYSRRLFILILFLPLALLVRQQLALCVLIYIYLMKSDGVPVRKICYLYVLTSLAAGYLSIHGGYITENVMRDGFSSLLVAFNQYFFYMGYLIFNPIRAIQYVFSGYAAFIPIDDYGGIDLFKLLCIPQMLVCTYFAKYIFKMWSKFRSLVDLPAKSMALTVVSYLLTWLMNPTVNGRYVMLITPILILFALYIKANNYEKS